MESIVKKANFSKGGLYHHFKSKDEIFLYANQKLSESICKMMEKVNKNINPKKGLIDYIKNYLNYRVTHKRELVFFFLSMSKALDQSDLQYFYEEYLDKYIEFYDNLFKKGIELKEFKNHDYKSNSIILISVMVGIIGYLILNKKLNVQEVIKSITEKFIYSISFEESR